MLRRTRHMLRLLKTLRSAGARAAAHPDAALPVVDAPTLPGGLTSPSADWLRKLPWLTERDSKLELRGPKIGIGALRVNTLPRSISVSGAVWLFLPRRPGKALNIEGSGTLWLWWWERGLCLRILRAQQSTGPGAPAPARRYALLIGVSRYLGEPSLPWVQADIEALATELEAHGYETDRLVSTPSTSEKDATVDNIDTHLERLKTIAADSDLLWVHYAGHGRIDGGLQLSAIDDYFSKDQIQKSMFASNAKALILTIDACNSGVATDSPPPMPAGTGSQEAQSYSCISACTEEQLAFPEDDHMKRSVFSGAIVDGLRQSYSMPVVWTSKRRRVITVNSMLGFISQRLADWSATKETHERQTPTIETNGVEDIYLVDF